MYNAIVTDKYTYEGNSTLIYNGTLSEVYANQNKGKAYITGFNLAFKSTLTASLTFDGSYSFTLGRVIETTNRPLDHIPPSFGRIGLNYMHKWGTVETYLLFNGKKTFQITAQVEKTTHNMRLQQVCRLGKPTT